MDILVKKLQEENRTEKLKRIKFQQVAEDIHDRENKIVNKMILEYDEKLKNTTEANRLKIAADYKHALLIQKQTVKEQMETIAG